MADEPTLPSLPKVSWDSHRQTFTNTRKRHRNGATPQPLFSNSSDPAVFSSDDDPHIDNYVEGRHHKRRYIGSWFQQMPASSDSTFAEVAGPQPKPNRTFERQLDSGVWMGSDELVDPADDEEFGLGIEPPSNLKLPQPRNPRPAPTVTPEQMVVDTRISAAIEEGNPDIDLSYVTNPPTTEAIGDDRLYDETVIKKLMGEQVPRCDNSSGWPYLASRRACPHSLS